jgi:hypothetical protein
MACCRGFAPPTAARRDLAVCSCSSTRCRGNQLDAGRHRSASCVLMAHNGAPILRWDTKGDCGLAGDQAPGWRSRHRRVTTVWQCCSLPGSARTDGRCHLQKFTPKRRGLALPDRRVPPAQRGESFCSYLACHNGWRRVQANPQPAAGPILSPGHLSGGMGASLSDRRGGSPDATTRSGWRCYVALPPRPNA